MSEAYQSLVPLIKKKSLITDPEKFQAVVNVVFHDYEAAHYDELHNEMWESLPQQYELLANDIEPHIKGRSNLKLLDIGCGTGLATALLLKTSIGSKISEVNLLDTSSKMLDEAMRRAKSWGKQAKTINGYVADVTGTYDIIIISSVLHHIPDLAAFLDDVNRIQKPGGIMIAIHDPNSAALESDVYNKRIEEYRDYRANFSAKKTPLARRVVNKIKRVLGEPHYITQVNQKLLADKVIKEPLTEGELWSITDIHVEELPYSTGMGISKELLEKKLTPYNLLSYRTYGFFHGILYSELAGEYKQKEAELAKQHDLHGRNLSTVWIKKQLIEYPFHPS